MDPVESRVAIPAADPPDNNAQNRITHVAQAALSPAPVVGFFS
jgi:hypothetical protein